jgi:hypothetical protein
MLPHSCIEGKQMVMASKPNAIWANRLATNQPDGLCVSGDDGLMKILKG